MVHWKFWKKKNGKAKRKEGVPYRQHKPRIRPFDVVFFRGGDAVSDLIRFAQKRGLGTPGAEDYSHVGMVVTSEILDDPRLEPGKLYIWESTMSGRLGDGVPNIDGEAMLGVQLRDLDEVVRAYDKSKKTAVAFGKVRHPPDFDDELRRKFTEVFQRLDGSKYDANPLSLLGSLIPALRPIRKISEDLLATQEWLFCSELVATVFIEVGIFPKWALACDVVPADFLGFDKDLVPRVLEHPVRVTWTQPSSFNASTSSLTAKM